MQLFPLIHILFWIGVTLCPEYTSQIVITGPDKTWTWTKEASDWSHSVDESVWVSEGTTVTSTSGDKTDKQDVATFVKGIKGHDWGQSPSLELGPMKSLTKEGNTLVYIVDAGEPSAKRFVIEFKKK